MTTTLVLLTALAAPGWAAPSTSSPIPEQSRQLLLVVSADWPATHAVMRLYERAGPVARRPTEDSTHTAWRRAGEPVAVSLGRSGLAWGRGLHGGPAGRPVKQEGDGRSPAGVFDLRLATGYAPEPLPGSRLPYIQATQALRCVDDVRSRHYNKLVDATRLAVDWSSAEEMRRSDGLYSHVVWVGHNDRPAQPGGGSCIFLHLRASPDSVTAGCTAFESEPMERLLRWLEPAAQPVLVQLPRAEYWRLRVGWGLPTLDD